MLSVLIPVLTTLIGAGTTLIVMWYKNKLDTDKNNLEICQVSECILEDTAVLEKLKEVLDLTHSDRICIFSFHNGGYYYSGKSMQKMSMSYEQVDNGVSSIQLSKQDIPVSACMTTLQPLMLNGEFWSADTNYWPIIDINNNAIGMLRLDYVKRKTKLAREDQASLELLSKQLPGYLTKYKVDS